MPVKVSPLVLLLLAVAADGFSGKALLVSMDGFRWDYIKDISGLSNFIRLAKTGVSVDHVENVFMTKTFPSQYSTVTGNACCNKDDTLSPQVRHIVTKVVFIVTGKAHCNEDVTLSPQVRHIVAKVSYQYCHG